MPMLKHADAQLGAECDGPEQNVVRERPGKQLGLRNRTVTLAHGHVATVNWPLMPTAFDMAHETIGRIDF